MSSTFRVKSVPISRTVNSFGSSSKLFQVSTIESAFNLTSSNPLAVKLSNSMYIANNQTALNTALTTLNAVATSISGDEWSLDDMGKTIQIGVFGGANDLIKFARVSRPTKDATATAASATGYVVIENRTKYFASLRPCNTRGA